MRATNKLAPLIGIQFIIAALIILNGAVPEAPLSPSSYFNPPYAYAWLNTLFLLPAGVAVADISSRAFLKDGHLSIQLMGCGILVLCIAPLSTWVGTNQQEIAFYYIMLNLGILCGGIFQAAGALLTTSDLVIPAGKRLLPAVGTYASLGLAAGFTWLAASEGWIPPFFTTSPTQLSIAVLIVAAAFYAVSAALLARNYAAGRSEILYWYIIGMLLVLTSILIYVFIRHPGDPISWLYRMTTFLYGGAFFTAVLNSRGESGPSE